MGCRFSWLIVLSTMTLLHVAGGSARGQFALSTLKVNVHTTGSLNWLIGWEFRPTVPITITHVGSYDRNSDGLSNAPNIGIYDATTQVLIASQTIPAGTAAGIAGPPVTTVAGPTVQGVFRYVPITPVALAAGQNYVIVGSNMGYTEPTADTSSTPNVRTTDPLIIFVQGRTKFFYSSTVLTFPNNTTGGAEFGPTFQFTPTGTPPPVPGGGGGIAGGDEGTVAASRGPRAGSGEGGFGLGHFRLTAGHTPPAPTSRDPVLFGPVVEFSGGRSLMESTALPPPGTTMRVVNVSQQSSQSGQPVPEIHAGSSGFAILGLALLSGFGLMVVLVLGKKFLVVFSDGTISKTIG